jgi:hypothetical protein
MLGHLSIRGTPHAGRSATAFCHKDDGVCYCVLRVAVYKANEGRQGG